MEIHKAFEEAILRAKNHPSLTAEDQAHLFGLHQQATSGDYAALSGMSADPLQLNAWEKLKGLTPDEARQQYITYVSELTKR